MTNGNGRYTIAPDYGHWCRMARWNGEWLAALLLGCDPKIVTAESVRSADCPEDLRQRYADMQAVIRNHQQTGRLPAYPEPGAFLSWAQSNRFEIPPALAEAFRAQGGDIADWQTENKKLKTEIAKLQEAQQASAKERRLLPREEQALLKLVLGMAMNKFRYKPDGGNSPAPKNIAGALLECGISIDEGTVLKWLRRAAEIVDCDRPKA